MANGGAVRRAAIKRRAATSGLRVNDAELRHAAPESTGYTSVSGDFQRRMSGPAMQNYMKPGLPHELPHGTPMERLTGMLGRLGRKLFPGLQNLTK